MCTTRSRSTTSNNRMPDAGCRMDSEEPHSDSISFFSQKPLSALHVSSVVLRVTFFTTKATKGHKRVIATLPGYSLHKTLMMFTGKSDFIRCHVPRTGWRSEATGQQGKQDHPFSLFSLLFSLHQSVHRLVRYRVTRNLDLFQRRDPEQGSEQLPQLFF
jgi:hypothetical protein